MSKTNRCSNGSVAPQDHDMAEHTVSTKVIALPFGCPHHEREIPKEQLN